MRIRIAIFYTAIGLVAPLLAVAASLPFDIEFPIAELENCADKNECKQYCDDLSHKDACLAFGKAHGLFTSDEAARVDKLPPIGPGGCRGEAECRAYCEDVSHTEECVAFGETHGLIDKKEAAQAREFMGQTGPGGCRGANECRAFCDDAAHGEECLEFANRKGLINARELEVARSLKTEGGPGGCRTPDECRTYCQDAAHLNECSDLAVRHGFLSAEEALRIKKQHVAAGPGGCSGQEACRTYCGDGAHQEECIAFGEKNGLMTSGEARRARAVAGKPGPGGCRGEECRTYCQTPDHADACIAFAEESGAVPPAELERAKKIQKISEEGGPGGCRGEACRAYCGEAAHQDECFDFAKAQGLIRPEDEHQFETARKLQETVRQAGGPGGCTGPEECRTYCTDGAHAEECVAFGVAHGGLPEGEVRAKLKEFSERRLGTDENEFHSADDVRRFEEHTNQRFEEFRELETEFRGAPIGIGFGPSAPGGEGSRPASGAPAGGGTVGPGGCSSPAECIKYCAEHKDECFSSGPGGDSSPGAVGGGRPGDQKGAPPVLPRLRQNLIFEVKPGELPQNFKELPPERREEIFRQRFDAAEGTSLDGGVRREQPGGKPEERAHGDDSANLREDSSGPRAPEPRSGPGAGPFPGKPPPGVPRPGGPGTFPGERRESLEPAKPSESPNRKPFENMSLPPGAPGAFDQPQTRPIEGVRPPEHTPLPPQPERIFTPPASESFPSKPPETFTPPTGNSFSAPSTSSGQAPPPVMNAPPPQQDTFAPTFQ